MIARLQSYLAIAGAFVLSLWLAWLRGRSSGATDAKATIQRKDAAHAREIEDRADAARADINDPVERLRASGRIRD